MSRMVIFFAIAVFLFSAAAGGSWYLQYRPHTDEDAPKAGEEKSAKANPAHGKGNTAEKPVKGSIVRPPVSPEADRLTRMTETLRQREDLLTKREQQLAVREKQVKMIHDEIENEHKKLAATRKEIDGELAAVNSQLELLEKKSASVDQDRQKADAQMEEVRRAIFDLNPVESKNLKQVAGLLDKMPPEASAQVVQQMVDKGKLDTAAAVLVSMRDRQAAGLLGEITKEDPGIAMQLFERIRYLKTGAASPK